jgi:hypothetical protein
VPDPVAELCLCSNAAFDLGRRVSAHAIFSIVGVPEVPFAFPGPFYAVVQLFAGGPGEHQVSVAGSAGLELESSSEKVMVTPDGFCIVVVTVLQCLIQSVGEHRIGALFDGQPIDGFARLVANEFPSPAEGSKNQ